MKTKKVPFDIEKAKNGAKVVTRCGYPVRIGFFDLKDKEYPIAGAVETNKGEGVIYFSKEGKYNPFEGESSLDLFIEEEVEAEESIKRLTPNQDGNIPNGAIVYEDLNGDEGFYKVHLDYLNKKQVEEIEETVRTWNTDENMIKACIGMCLTDASEQRFRNYNTNLKDCLAWLEKQGKQKTADNVAPKSDILKNCLLKRDKDYIDSFRPWDIKDGDVLVCIGKYGQEIGIVKKYVGKYGGCDKCFETYCFVDWEGIFRLGEYMGSKEIYPATKEQCDLLFQRMKEAGYMWNSDKKELHKIDPKFKVGDKVVLKRDKSLVGSITLVSFIGTYCIHFKDFNAGWYSEQELEPCEMIEKEVKTRRMTNQELSWWLRDSPEEHREFKFKCDGLIFSSYEYRANEADTPVEENSLLIRRNHGEWQEPLVEI